MIAFHPAQKLAALALPLLLAGSAHAAIYVTQIPGTLADLTGPSFNRIQVEWSTGASFGAAVNETQLSDWRISFFNDSTLVYTDLVISSGLIQTIGGVERTLNGMMFNGFSAQSVTEMDNDKDVVQFENATGVTYNIYNGGFGVYTLAYYQNGVFQSDGTFSYTTQNTVVVPEPETYAAIAMAACAGLVIYRKRRGV